MAVDNYDWLQSIADNAELGAKELTGAYDLLGVETTLTDDEVDWALFYLETEGYLESQRLDDDTVLYTFHIPETAVA